MTEEPVIPTLRNIRNRGLQIVGLAVLAVIGSVATLLNFSVKAQKSSQTENAQAAAELDGTSNLPLPGRTSKSTQPSSSEHERQVVMEARKAGCASMIAASASKLQEARQLIGDRDLILRNLETNDLGRQLAVNDDLIEMFLAIREVELPAVADIDEAQVVLDGLQTKLQLYRSGFDLDKVQQLRIELQQLGESAQLSLYKAVLAKRNLDALLLLAEREAAGSLTLGEAVERYELEITAEHQLRIAQATRSARAQQLAEEEAKVEEFNREIAALRSEMSDSQRRIQFTEEQAKQELAKRSAAKRRLEVEFQRDLADIRSLLKPFITPGYTQHLHKFAYRPDQNPNPRPVSFGSLVSIGYLHNSNERQTAFWRSTVHDNDRPLGSFPKANYGQTQLPSHIKPVVQRAQNYLRKYGNLMVEKKMLSP